MLIENKINNPIHMSIIEIMAQIGKEVTVITCKDTTIKGILKEYTKTGMFLELDEEFIYLKTPEIQKIFL